MMSEPNIHQTQPQNTTPLQQKLIIRQFNTLQDYTEKFNAMRDFTHQRDDHTVDELWLLQHPSVLTQGQAGKPEHILLSTNIPIVQTDRGGQVTWHGEGQLVGYFLFDLNRLHWHVRDLVNFAEHMMLGLLSNYQIDAYTKKDAPGVYVAERKIGSLGFKIRHGCSYHGISLNIDCDLTGFHSINPCGFAGLEMVRLCDLLTNPPSFAQLCQDSLHYIQQKNIYSQIEFIQHD